MMESNKDEDDEQLQNFLDKLELKVELLLQNMQLDLTQLVRKHKSVEDPNF
jgi:hypothetical protein